MTEAELVRLLDVARRRPLLEALTVRRGKRKGEAYANVRPEVRERLEAARPGAGPDLQDAGAHRAAEERAGEPDRRSTAARRPHASRRTRRGRREEPGGERRRRSAPTWRTTSKLWLADKLTALQADARRRGEPIPAELPADTPVFDVPAGLVRIFDRDLKHAGIPKRDERGRTLDVHALRTTFGTLLSRGGVPLADGPSRDAAFRPEPDRERLHRPQAARRERGPRRLADPSARRGPDPVSGAMPERPGPTPPRRSPLHCPLH